MRRIVFSTKATIRLAALLTLAEAGTVGFPVRELGNYFGFPDVRRQSAAYGLTLLHQNQAQIVPAYYVFMVG